MSPPEHRVQHRLPRAVPRRTFVGLGLAATAGLACGLSGCGRSAASSAAAKPLEVSLADLADGAHRLVQVGGRPVDVVRRGEKVVALSMLCSHMGCVVRWTPEQNRYICPCHQGQFDAEGRAIDGPPVKPLDTVPVRIDGSVVRVG